MKKRNNILGLILILLGIIFLFDNLGYIEFSSIFSKYWPMALIVLGIINLLENRSSKLFSWILILIGSFLQLDRLDIFLIDIWNLFIPLLLIIAGMGLIMNRKDSREDYEEDTDFNNHGEHYQARESHGDIYEDEIVDEEVIFNNNSNNFTNRDLSYDEFIDIRSLFTERKIINKSDSFKGGKISSIVATTIVDLRDARFYEDQAIIDVNSILGNVEILVEKNCRVEITGTPILGGWNNYKIIDSETERSLLRIRGLVILGGIEIK